jgi:predicted lactoylglutathione lyase
MIGYVTIGTNNLTAASAFFDALLTELGARRVITNERMVMWGNGRGKPMLAVCIPYDKQEATTGNGTMIALQLESKEQVERLHAKALELGGSDEGAAGERMPGFYGAYFRDLDGNKFVGYTMG